MNTKFKIGEKVIYKNNNDCFIYNSNELMISVLDRPKTSNYYRANIVCLPQNDQNKQK